MARSGAGKTTSLRNLDPEQSVVVQVLNKGLPFENAPKWKKWNKETQSGSRIFLSSVLNMQSFITKAVAAGKKIIIVDDLVYIMANKVMAEVENTSWDKWTYLAKEIFDFFNFFDSLPEDVRVYILTHVEEDSNGNIKMKTAGKLLDNLITPEGMFAMVLGAEFKDGNHYFKTNKDRNSEPYKTPMGMFEEKLINNDLKAIDDRICEYYDINQTKQGD